MASVSMSENLSCLLYGPFDARYEKRPVPVLEDPNDVIVQIAFTGVCGSDVGLSAIFHLKSYTSTSKITS